MLDLVKVLSVPSIMEGEIREGPPRRRVDPRAAQGRRLDPTGAAWPYVFVPTEFEAQARLLVEDVSDETT